ncbi:MAG TPA: Uma2 family endonuclease [Gemmatimonadaceae bacterium]|nr:Uma2 family endonuclease [Gemmatimonadaceae bacterium]
MGMAAPLKSYTADMVRALNDQHDWGWPRYEVVDGELLVTPSPRRWHQRVAFRLARALAEYLDREPVGEVLPSPADISWGPKMLVQPDVFVVPLDEARQTEWSDVRHLLLVAEVLSPGSARGDRIVKRQLYQREGVPLYWMVDVDARAVEVWTPDAQTPRVERELLVWHPTGASTPFTLALATLFRPV